MNFTKYLEDKKAIQGEAFKYLETKDDENFESLSNLLNQHKLRDNPKELKLFFNLLVSISNNYSHGTNFYAKIFRILQNFKSEISKYYTNMEIFEIFGSNKRLLLYFIDEKLIILEREIILKIVSYKNIKLHYHLYFQPEIKPFIQNPWFPKKSENYWVSELEKPLPKDFEENRRIGENESLLCKIIRNDSISEFISYVKENHCSLNSIVSASIYETNIYLIKTEEEPCNSILSLLSYSAYFGSIQIFKYLLNNGVKLRPFTWIYSIHSKNLEFLQILDDNKIIFEDETCQYNLIESIKCYNEEFVYYFLKKYLNKMDGIENLILSYSVKFYNFQLIDPKLINESALTDFCKYDYFTIVQDLLKNKKIDVNKIKITHMKYTSKSDYFGDYRSFNIEKEIITNPFYSSVKKKCIDIIKLLFNCDNLDPNVPYKKYSITRRDSHVYSFTVEETAFYHAITLNNIELVKPLLTNKKIDVNVRQIYKDGETEIFIKTALFYSVINDLVEMVKLLINVKGIDMNAPINYVLKSKGNNGCFTDESYTKPPLYRALERGNIEVIKLLLSNKTIDVNIPYSYHMYGKSVSYKQWECTPYDLESQMVADEVDCDEYDMPPLYYAINNKKIDYVKLILANNKVDVNKPFKNYRIAEKRKLGKCFDVTPLVCAVKTNDATIVGLLLENKNIDIDSKDQDGKKPIDYAKSDEIIKLLKH